MKRFSAKILLLAVIVILVQSCNAVKKLDDDEYLLTKNTILENGDKVTDYGINSQLSLKPNAGIGFFPLKLFLFNEAKKNPDSLFNEWLYRKPKRPDRLNSLISQKQVKRLGVIYRNWNEFKRTSGQAPSIISDEAAQNSANRLKEWYYNHGWFDAAVDYTIEYKEDQRGSIDYNIDTGKPYVIDSISRAIESSVADSIYSSAKRKSFIKEDTQYKTLDFNIERDRITTLFRNNGLYHFDQEAIKFEADTIQTGNKIDVKLIVDNRSITRGDSTFTVPYKVHKISEVNVFTDYSFENRNKFLTDTTSYEGYNFYAYNGIKYTPKSLTDVLFIKKGDVYADLNRTLTAQRIAELRTFNLSYGNIIYQPDPRDSTGTKLISNIFLEPRKRFGASVNFDVSRSNIQDLGIALGGSVLVRNVFNRLETLELSGRGSFGSSDDAATSSQDRFFNISEIGADLTLSIPRILFPINTEKFIKKSMSPFTQVSTGVSSQQNIGLDKRNVTGRFSYNWKPKPILRLNFDLVNLQYVRNLNVENYFNVYTNSFTRLNEIAAENFESINESYFKTDETGELEDPLELSIPFGTSSLLSDFENELLSGLTNDEEQTLNTIDERRDRLTEDNFILASNFSYLKNTRRGINDEDYSRFRAQFELAGNSLALLAPLIGLEQNQDETYDLFGVQFSQYAKLELDFIKHWEIGEQQVIAVRALGGLALPYGNSNSIPFARSFFAGGPNDNRGWQAYTLGPGSTGGPDEFNEANMKLAFNAEYRFNLFGSFNLGLFTDIGNIWNIYDNVDDTEAVFDSFTDLKELAIGSGFGIRYDVNIFVIRADAGFKTYEPGREGNQWFANYNFANTVYHFGINYPF
ncbi:BamA/TamA family outer membrane protein [Gangjinia marincola]|uniref:translocation and assembly module lipoprotein TamL n=1 Tax=Gangjinia marincola TaxID=578463 RepID=UPI0031D46D55